MSIIENASRIIDELAQQHITDTIDNYIAAKTAFITIAYACLEKNQSVFYNFETELNHRHTNGLITPSAYRILWWNLDIILEYYKTCTGIKQPKKEKSLKEKVLKQADLLQEIDCAICLNQHTKSEVFCVTACQHEFGKECLQEWLKVTQHCPLCRTSAKEIHGYKGRKVKVPNVVGPNAVGPNAVGPNVVGPSVTGPNISVLNIEALTI